MTFFGRIRKRAADIDSLLCVGLDPHINQLEQKDAEGAFEFCKRLIEATSPYAAAYKPNAAFFEALGPDGVAALKRVIHLARDGGEGKNEGIPVLLDAKRGDISTTAQAYADSAFEEMGADAITLSPYMGFDSIGPFIQDPNRGVFVLCKTSNPSSADLQTVLTKRTRQPSTGSEDSLKARPPSPSTPRTRMLYEQVAELAGEWNKADNVGLVVGATDVAALRRVRNIDRAMWILAPGVGAQGGDLAEACQAGLSNDGMGLLLPVSREISKSQDPGATALRLRDQINQARELKKANPDPDSGMCLSDGSEVFPYQQEFMTFCLEQQVLKFGEFTLKSGRKSPYFFNAGLFRTGEALVKLGRYYAEAIVRSGIEFDVLFGPAYKGIPLVAAVSMSLAQDYDLDKGFAYNRKEAKDHGEGGSLVGADIKGQRVLVIDDVITAGTAIREAVGMLSHSEAQLCGVVLALDRQEKASETSTTSAVQQVEEEFNVPVVSIVGLRHLTAFLSDGSHGEETLNAVREYRKKYGV
eukprot:CAMPEP_0113942702 /NCGR_PEP_ID=MMETSP1339-20121228/8346_1 /TAXON_ID=94617 /ORGANISM="Fibrocapsa japonica" /LENGTH=525 /DNA_ID=CAMNT_0000947247 /DNA_START=81 /DNA_END=1658 /DNA_ORIENTATION=+ /assembly_acc=CAM_ASM_000762